jgi:hypothetical protein
MPALFLGSAMGKVHMSLFHKSLMPHGMCTLHADARPRLPYVVVVCES